MAALNKEEFIKKCCGGFSKIELNIVNNTWCAALQFYLESEVIIKQASARPVPEIRPKKGKYGSQKYIHTTTAKSSATLQPEAH
jgi:hypothetical protein